MQNHLWDCVDQKCIHIHRDFMENIFKELNDDTDTRAFFFTTIFEKMHFGLKNIKSELFP